MRMCFPWHGVGWTSLQVDPMQQSSSVCGSNLEFICLSKSHGICCLEQAQSGYECLLSRYLPLDRHAGVGSGHTQQLQFISTHCHLWLCSNTTRARASTSISLWPHLLTTSRRQILRSSRCSTWRSPTRPPTRSARRPSSPTTTL